MRQMVLKAYRHLKSASGPLEEKKAILEAERVLVEALGELGHTLKRVGISNDPGRQQVGRLFRSLSEGILPEKIALGELLKAVEYEELEREVGKKLDDSLDEGRIELKTIRELAELRLLQASTHTILALSFLLGARRGEDGGKVIENLLRGLECASIALDCVHGGWDERHWWS